MIVIQQLLLYGVETALQLNLAELNEALRDVYVSAYSLPTTSDQIHKLTAGKLYKIFSANFPDYLEKDFYELEIGTAGLMRGYMAKPCDMYFTMEQKIRRFLEVSFRVYRVPEERLTDAFDFLMKLDLHTTARKLVDKTIAAYGGNT